MSPFRVQQFFLYLVFALLTSVTAQSAPYQIGEPILSGSGCPIGTARAVLSRDGSSVSILFDEFVVNGKKGGNYYLSMRKFCRFQIPVTLSPGLGVVATQVDYRGFAHVQNGNRAFLVTAGPLTNMGEFSVGEQSIKTEFRNQTKDFLVTQPIPVAGNPICSLSTLIDFNVVIQLFGPSPRGPLYLFEDAMVTLDSADFSEAAPISLHLSLRPCR